MKSSVSPRRISRHLIKSLGVLFILVLVVLAYTATPLTAFAGGILSGEEGGVGVGGGPGGVCNGCGKPAGVPSNAVQWGDGRWYWCDKGQQLYALADDTPTCKNPSGTYGKAHHS